MSIYNEFTWVQLKIIESEKLAGSTTFDLYFKNKCSFLPIEKPHNYSQNEVLEAIEKINSKKG